LAPSISICWDMSGASCEKSRMTSGLIIYQVVHQQLFMRGESDMNVPELVERRGMVGHR
jgi:hypothetical protein